MVFKINILHILNSVLYVVLFPLELNGNFLPPANEVRGKVIFSEACVTHSVHEGGVRGSGAWLGVCVAGGMHDGGVWQRGCVARGLHGRGRACIKRARRNLSSKYPVRKMRKKSLCRSVLRQ